MVQIDHPCNLFSNDFSENKNINNIQNKEIIKEEYIYKYKQSGK